MAIGDFNGDGRADIATANFGSNNVSILLNNAPNATLTISEFRELVFTLRQFVTFNQLDNQVSPGFDEILYLLANPDVADAVAKGVITSGAQHYSVSGQFEGRSLLPMGYEYGGITLADLFDETYYLAHNPDVAQAIQTGQFANGFGHFLRAGLFEGRNPSSYYSEAFYLANNADIQAEIAQGRLTSGLPHYLLTGHRENRIASELFDANDYLLNNPDVQAAVNQGFLTAPSSILWKLEPMRGEPQFCCLKKRSTCNRTLTLLARCSRGKWSPGLFTTSLLGRKRTVTPVVPLMRVTTWRPIQMWLWPWSMDCSLAGWNITSWRVEPKGDLWAKRWDDWRSWIINQLWGQVSR